MDLLNRTTVVCTEIESLISRHLLGLNLYFYLLLVHKIMYTIQDI
jgi:hypothetical protein